jgi:hypothetical protein
MRMPVSDKMTKAGALMSDAQNRRLFGLLKKNETLKLKGYSLAYSQSTGVVIDRAGHVHGIWNYAADNYTWVSPSSSEPKFRTEDAKSAVLYTVVVLAQD